MVFLWFFWRLRHAQSNNEARPVIRCLHPPRAGCQGYRGRSPAGAPSRKRGKSGGKSGGKLGKILGKYEENIWKTRNQTGKSWENPEKKLGNSPGTHGEYRSNFVRSFLQNSLPKKSMYLRVIS